MFLTFGDSLFVMPNSLFTLYLPSGNYEARLASVVGSWPEFLELFSKPASIAIMAAGLLGLIVGWLVRGRDANPGTPVELVPPGMAILRWRHEKLVLTERQQVEKQGRLDAFAEAFAHHGTVAEMTIGLRFFVLAERLREARQKVGSDLSRMVAVRDQLVAIPVNAGREIHAVAASREIADSKVAMLEEARDQLRTIGQHILRLEKEVASSTLPAADRENGLRKALMEIKGDVLSLPQGWASSGDEADRQIRELLAMAGNGEIAAVRDILLIDGANTGSLSGSGGIDLAGAVSAVMAALDRETTATTPILPIVSPPLESNGTGAAEMKPLTGITFIGNPFSDDVPEPLKPLKLTPDSGFRDPREFERAPVRIGGGFHDLTNDLPSVEVVSEAEIVEENRSLILFCSNNVELWGKDTYRGAHCRARAIKVFPDWAQWISIRRLDTRERVFAPVRTASLFNGQTSDPVGFNGTNELFYGARHLGIFSESCPNEVETRFTYGGWGFGHRANEITPDVEQLQAAGWEGREIPADTVFEIVIHAELPVLCREDRILEVGAVKGRG